MTGYFKLKWVFHYTARNISIKYDWKIEMIGATERQSYLDWLRVLTVLLLVPFHSANIFIFNYYWWLTSTQKNLAASIFVSVLDQYHMPLLFFVAGAATWFSLGARTGNEYLLERIKRLLIPIISCSLLFIAAQHFISQDFYFYFNPANQLKVNLAIIKPFGNFFQHYPDILLHDLIPFTKGWNAGELWFISYLFLYSIVLFPLFLLIRKKSGRFISWIERFFEKRGAIFLLAIPIAMVTIYPPPPIANIWEFTTFPLFYYIFFFVYGFIIVSSPLIQEGLRKSGPIAIVGGLATMTIFLLLILPPADKSPLGAIYWPALGYKPGTIGYALYWTLRSINGWFWIIGLLYLSKRFLNFSNRFLRYANEAVLPFYAMHAFSIVFIGFFILKLNMGVLPKFVIIVICSLAMTLILYELVKRNNVTRFLIGMRIKKKPDKIIS